MIFLSIGLPSRFAELCDAVATQLVTAALGPADLVYADTLEEAGLAAIRSQSRHLIIAARLPIEQLRSALAASEMPFLVVFDDPRLALQHLVARRGLEWNHATRAVANSCAAILQCAVMPGAVILRADCAGRAMAEIAVALADALRLPIDPERAAQCADAFGGFAPAGMQAEFDPWWESVGQEQRKLADGALAAYADYFAGGQLGEFVWRRELFFLGDDPHRLVGPTADLAGAVRNLVFGPYIALPPGRWSATVSLAVSREAADMNFRVEVLAGAQCACLGSANTLPDSRGLSFATLEFNIDRLTEQPISLRAANLRPVAGGRFAFGNVRLRQLNDTAVEVPAELTHAVGT
jgi:hypothetical protein